MKRMKAVVLAAVLGGALAACAPIIRSHGYTPDDTLLADIAAGQDTRSSVAQKIGRPVTASAFDDDGWYYVSSTVRHYMWYAPEVTDRRIVAVRFDENDMVADVKTYGIEDGRIINLATGTTPTHGRELTIIQQVLGNFGRITGEDLVGQQ
ncbi:MAG TPA: outer membrane protein assembly factor BamE [Thermohalobaculum sp.]|nr:outer membrane protein assembly factor BamE [Thermohalobaculum sp.]